MTHVTDRVMVETADGRQAALVPADDAGEFRIEVVGADPWSALEAMGAIGSDEKAAADRHAAVWADTGWRREGRSGFEPMAGRTRSEYADALDEEQMEAWRLFRRAQASMPVFCRSVVYNMVAWSVWPADVRAVRIGLRALVRVYGV